MEGQAVLAFLWTKPEVNGLLKAEVKPLRRSMVVSGSSLAQGNCEVLTTMLRASHSNRLSCDSCPIMFKNFAYYGLLVLMSSNNYLFLFSLTNTNFRSRRTRYSACKNLFRKPLWAYSQGRSPKWCPALLLYCGLALSSPERANP